MRRRIQQNQRGRKGFTLMELMLVMAILVILASMGSVFYLQLQSNAKRDAAFTQISMLSDACNLYKLQVGNFPSSMGDLIAQPSGLTPNQWRGPYLKGQSIPRDPWGNEYQYTPDDLQQRVTITSAGPDRQVGTQDDIPDSSMPR